MEGQIHEVTEHEISHIGLKSAQLTRFAKHSNEMRDIIITNKKPILWC